MKTTNILFTCAGRRNYLINYFKEALNGNGKILAVDCQTDAPALIDADIAVQVPDIYSTNYIEKLKKICREHEINAIISLNDLELPILSEHKRDLEKEGIMVILSDERVIDISFDKWKTFEFLNSIDILTPRTYIDMNMAIRDLDSKIINFPLVLKPRWGSASIGIEFVENREELLLAYRLLKSKLSKSILNIASSDDREHSILIQENIDGTEYGMDVLNDFYGNYYSTFAREKLSMRAGETDKAMSVIDSRLNEVGKTLSKNLKHIGNLDCDLFVKGNSIYVLELNPRFGGGYPFSHEAGANSAAIYIAWINGDNNVDKYNSYKANICYSKCDRLIKIPSLRPVLSTH